MAPLLTSEPPLTRARWLAPTPPTHRLTLRTALSLPRLPALNSISCTSDCTVSTSESSPDAASTALAGSDDGIAAIESAEAAALTSAEAAYPGIGALLSSAEDAYETGGESALAAFTTDAGYLSFLSAK